MASALLFDCANAVTQSSQRGFMLAWILPHRPPLLAMTHSHHHTSPPCTNHCPQPLACELRERGPTLSGVSIHHPGTTISFQLKVPMSTSPYFLISCVPPLCNPVPSPHLNGPFWTLAHGSDSTHTISPDTILLWWCHFLPRVGLHTSSLCLSSQLIAQLKKEIPALIEEVEQMSAEVWNPREVVFKDILLKRPKYVVPAVMLG